MKQEESEISPGGVPVLADPAWDVKNLIQTESMLYFNNG